MARVRGIGVAVRTSWCGTRLPSRPLSRKARRWCTPKRCCSSMMTRPRLRKADALLHQGVRADDDLCIRGQRGERRTARLALDLAGQPDRLDAERRKPGRRGCADAVRRAVRSAPSRRPGSPLRSQPWPPRRRRWSFPNRHRPARGAASVRLARDPLAISALTLSLRGGQRKRQRVEQRIAHGSVAAQRGRTVLANLRAQTLEAEVMGQQLLEGQPASAPDAVPSSQRSDIRIGRRPMHEQQRFAQRDQVQRLAQRCRNQFEFGIRRQALQRQFDEAADALLAESFGGRIDRRQRTRRPRRRPRQGAGIADARFPGRGHRGGPCRSSASACRARAVRPARGES